MFVFLTHPPRAHPSCLGHLKSMSGLVSWTYSGSTLTHSSVLWQQWETWEPCIPVVDLGYFPRKNQGKRKCDF